MAEAQEPSATLPSTQDKLDPRRLGRNNSGLSEQDVSDVVCILHPSSPAAFRIVADTAQRNPQHVLQNQGLQFVEEEVDLSGVSEADTILLPKTQRAEGPRDLALRFSSRVVDVTTGFCFGRNVYKCDINLDPDDTQKRVSNQHYRIFLNDNGVLMLEDMSTNGTLVDGMPLGGRKKNPETGMVESRQPNSRMLSHGSIIEVISPKEELVIKFILRVPSRDRFRDQYHLHFLDYVHHVHLARNRAAQAKRGLMPEAHQRAVMAAPLAGPVNDKAIPGPAPQTASTGFGLLGNVNDRYNCVSVLGKGAFATVYQVATTYSGEYFAAKELDKKRFMKNNMLDFRLENEMNIMRDLNHDNIVKYIEVFDTERHLYIIMEFVSGGDLQGYLQSHGTMPEDSARLMTRQILDALHYLHGKNITHRDIKPDNILLSSETPFNVKLTDFGLSKVVKNNETFLKTFCGTLLYCAPEVFPHYQAHMANKRPKRRRQDSQNRGRRTYTHLVDIWSYAAVLWTVLRGKPPFEGVVDAEGKGMFNQIMQNALDTTPIRECGVSEDACDLLLLMLDTDPTSRPSEAECLRHPWLNNGRWVPDEEGLPEIQELLEPESDAGQLHVQASQLGIDDPGVPGSSHLQTKSDRSHDSDEDRGRKRVRGENSFAPEQVSVPLIAQIDNPPPTALAPPGPIKEARLFGEISQNAALQSSGALNSQTGLFQNGYRDSQLEAQGSCNGSSNYSAEGDSRILDWGLELSHTNNGNENAMYTSQQQPQEQKGLSTYLAGATSMVRELHMADAPTTPMNTTQGSGNDAQQQQATAGANPPTANTTPKNNPQTHGKHSQSSSVDQTPKPRKSFQRTISLPITASSYYNPFDETTHSVQWASRISGHDFERDPQADDGGVTSMPETVQQSFRSGESVEHEATNGSDRDAYAADNALQSEGGSFPPESMFPKSSDHSHEEAASSTVAANAEPSGDEIMGNNLPQPPPGPSDLLKQATAGAQAQSEFAKPPPRYGRLVSTPDSFMPLTIPLFGRYTTWGRLPSNSQPYANRLDTRVPKLGLELIFEAPGAKEAERDGKDWTQLPYLRLLILTRSRSGVWVNGVRLAEKDEKGQRYYGRLCDGDEVEIFRPQKFGAAYREGDPEKGLTFKVEIGLETAKWARQQGKGFEVLKEHGEAGGSQ